MKTLKHFLLPFFFCTLYACSTMSPFSERAYNYVVTTKVDALALMGKAITPYTENQEAIETFTNALEKAKAYDATRSLNSETNQMWAIITDPEKHLLGGFLKEWKQKETMSATLIKFKQKQVEKAFDELARLEQGKSHAESELRY